jgi:uncharacterized protein YciI
MNYFFYRQNPPCPTFPGDMTASERALMQEHVEYWTRLMEQGRVLAFGPVADPKGTYGIGIIRVEDSQAAEALAANDPVILADAGFGFEVHAMPRLMVAERLA